MSKLAQDQETPKPKLAARVSLVIPRKSTDKLIVPSPKVSPNVSRKSKNSKTSKRSRRQSARIA